MRNGTIAATGVSKSFGRLQALQNVSLQVASGEVVCLIGPSGSGKSTLLRCLNHLEVPDRGDVRVAGHRIGFEQRSDRLRELSARRTARQRADVGMVFQRFNLFSHLTAAENVETPLRHVRSVPRAERRRRSTELLAQVGLAAQKDRYPVQLSGGQQQRVAIARALALEPAVMLFDEPTSALDPELVSEVLDVLRKLAEQGMTMVIATHEIGFARDVADRIIFMESGQIVEQGDARELIARPQTERLQRFLSHVL